MGVVVRLRKGRERAVERSPWIFSGAVESTEGRGEAGDAADVVDWKGRWVGLGWWNPAAELRVRVLTRREGEALDEAWLRGKLRQAAGMRTQLFGRREEWRETSGWRMVFSEADGLSGLVADQYDGTLLVELGAKGWERWSGVIADELKAATGAERAVVRASEEAAKREGMSAVPAGDAAGVVRFRENGWNFEADLGAGQKTGFYLDQRDNRRIVAELAAGRDVLSAYCYTGGFEIGAAHVGAKSVTGWDSSAAALAQARRHAELNPGGTAVAWEEADVPRRLRAARDRRESWDLIVLDPPKLVTSRGALERGLRGYKDINLLAMKLLRPGGILATFSCSGLVDPATFKTAVGWAAKDVGREVKVLRELGAGADHPVGIFGEESQYLKGLLCWVE